ncbi:MAG: RNA polymerase sigma factor [Planctomycetota bacterium]|jgi:RNA polymerase sigma-70 factor (ECF subfamily)|nr:RNA polymerase sigma factor [Planctomycetota bacterium]
MNDGTAALTQPRVVPFETAHPAEQEEKTIETADFDFVEVVDQFETPLLRYVMHLTGKANAADPEDVVQEVFLRLHGQVEQHGSASIRNMKSWLYRVAHNRVMDLTRRKAAEQKATTAQEELVESDQADPTDGLAELVRKEAGDRAMSELQHLPEEEKHVILLKVVHGMKLREISEITGLTTGNIDYRIKRGLKTLATRLKAGGVI